MGLILSKSCAEDRNIGTHSSKQLKKVERTAAISAGWPNCLCLLLCCNCLSQLPSWSPLASSEALSSMGGTINRALMSNCIPQSTMGVIIYPCTNLTYFLFIKMSPEVRDLPSFPIFQLILLLLVAIPEPPFGPQSGVKRDGGGSSPADPVSHGPPVTSPDNPWDIEGTTS